MITSLNRKSLETLISSQGGLHFSAYVSTGAGASPLRLQLEEAIKVAAEDIKPVLKRNERKKFLKPLQTLLKDNHILPTIKGNIGIFRSENFFRILQIPVAVDEYVTVASSFHIKPLLKWLQEDRDFLLLCVSENISRLYAGTQHSFKHLESFEMPKNPRIRLNALSEWLGPKLDRTIRSYRCPVFLMAPKSVRDFLKSQFQNEDLRFINHSEQNDIATTLAAVRAALQNEVGFFEERKLKEFQTADALELTESNINKVARAANRGLVKKLLVASNKKVFGKLNSESGTIVFRGADVDHEDEDLLDDIAQAVISHGGEVTLSPIERIPRQQPLLALAEPEDPEMRTNKVPLDILLRLKFIKEIYVPILGKKKEKKNWRHHDQNYF